MPDHLKKFYTLEEVKNELAESADPKLSSDLAIKRFIETHLLTPYVHYKGFINSVKSVYSKSREDTIKELSATINEDITSLQLKELVDPQRYDTSLDVDAIIYQTKKLLTTFKDEYAMGNDGVAHYIEGIFSISSNNVTHTNLGLKVIIGDYEPISHHIKFILNNPFGNKNEGNNATLVREDEVFGWILHMPDSDYYKATKLEKKCKLIFSSQDLNFILRKIENINLAPKLAKDLKEANRLINQQNKEIERLENQLKFSTKPSEGMENTKDSVYRMVCILKDIILKLDQDENNQAFNFEKQTDLVDYIENKDIPKLSRSNIEKILSQANKALFD